ncbi:MAG: hypothetical protein B7Z43_05570, partial [Sphingomonas sp. 12-62-6]
MVSAMWRLEAINARECRLRSGASPPKKGTRPQKRGVTVPDEMLSSYRQSIDNIDAALVFLLA